LFYFLTRNRGPIAQTIVARYEAVEWEEGGLADSHRRMGGSDRREGES